MGIYQLNKGSINMFKTKFLQTSVVIGICFQLTNSLVEASKVTTVAPPSASAAAHAILAAPFDPHGAYGAKVGIWSVPGPNARSITLHPSQKFAPQARNYPNGINPGSVLFYSFDAEGTFLDGKSFTDSPVHASTHVSNQSCQWDGSTEEFTCSKIVVDSSKSPKSSAH